MGKKGALTFLGIFIFFTAARGDGRSLQINLFGGKNWVMSYGSTEEYRPGENDFPDTPAHGVLHFGTGLAYVLRNGLGFELEGRAYLSTNITLTDPSDGDTSTIRSAPHISLAFNIFYEFDGARLSPYVLVGGGFDAASSKAQSVVSQKGYEVTFSSRNTIIAMLQAGIGARFFVQPRWGVRMDARYVHLLGDPDAIRNICVSLGLFFDL
jgi:outer membrane protein W